MLLGLPEIFVILVVLGGLAAVVWGIVYAIANKRPGVAVASVLVPLGLLGFAGLLGLLFWNLYPVVLASRPAHVNWTAGPTMPSMPPMPPMPAMPAASFTWNLPPIAVLIGVAVLLLGLVALLRKRSCQTGERRGVRGWVVTALAIVGVALLVREATLERRSWARPKPEPPKEISKAVEEAEQKLQAAAVKLEELRNRGHATNSETIQQLWEQLNRPRIDLETGDPSATTTVGDGSNQVELRADENAKIKTDAKLVMPISNENAESLSRSIVRLERMVEQVSAVADQLSDAGTLVGKGMIALSDAAASRPRAIAGAAATTSQAANADWPAVSPAPVVHEAAAQVKHLAPRTIEIALDEQKLGQFELSYPKIKDVLGRDAFWRGTSVQFIPDQSRIVVTGDLEGDYESRLGGALIGTVGRQRRPIHLSDVATITASPESIVHVATSSDIVDSTRPAWVDEPPKNIGNVRRQVIVAGDFVTPEECNREADWQLYVVTFDHLKELCGDAELDRISVPVVKLEDGRLQPSAAEFAARQYAKNTLNRMGVGIDFIRREIAKKEYVETVERSVGPMKQLHVQVEFSPSIDQELRQRWEEVRRQDRFAVVGVGAGSVLGLLGLVFGLLKVDTWTKGYYTKRLFFGVPAAIIGLITLLMATILT